MSYLRVESSLSLPVIPILPVLYYTCVNSAKTSFAPFTKTTSSISAIDERKPKMFHVECLSRSFSLVVSQCGFVVFSGGSAVFHGRFAIFVAYLLFFACTVPNPPHVHPTPAPLKNYTFTQKTLNPRCESELKLRLTHSSKTHSLLYPRSKNLNIWNARNSFCMLWVFVASCVLSTQSRSISSS